MKQIVHVHYTVSMTYKSCHCTVQIFIHCTCTCISLLSKSCRNHERGGFFASKATFPGPNLSSHFCVHS